ncbi:MAG: outer membrane beta-barrel domain-containing protein [Bdellovibrionota bacterium]
MPQRLTVNWERWRLVCLIMLFLLPDFFSEKIAVGARFDDYEIRVIRPRYFSKRKKFELGLSGSVVTNQTFIYTYLGSLNVTYHFTEQFALELAGAYGFSIDKDDKRILDDDFSIKTQIIRTQYLMEGSVLYTPIYGKYQLASGRLIYFDTFFALGAGISGVDYNYEQCLPPEDQANPDSTDEIPAPQVYQYPTITFGVGQKYFINKRDGIKWEVRDHYFTYDRQDGGCPGEPSEKNPQHNMTLQVGYSRFF